jgi:hypothetical protein
LHIRRIFGTAAAVPALRFRTRRCKKLNRMVRKSKPPRRAAARAKKAAVSEVCGAYRKAQMRRRAAAEKALAFSARF